MQNLGALPHRDTEAGALCLLIMGPFWDLHVGFLLGQVGNEILPGGLTSYPLFQ
jgi:hypothetical protein